MADNGNSSLFAMDGDQMNLEDKVLSVKIPTDGANCAGSKYSGKPVLLSSKLRLCPISCAQRMVSYPAVCGRKNPPTIKLAHTLGQIERRGGCVSVRIPNKRVRGSRMGGADMLIYPLRPISTPSHLLTRGSAIPSVSINLAEHHQISTACLLSWSLTAELLYPRPCYDSYLSTSLAKPKEDRARRHLGKA